MRKILFVGLFFSFYAYGQQNLVRSSASTIGNLSTFQPSSTIQNETNNTQNLTLRNAPSLNKLNTNPLPETSSGKGNALSNQKQIFISDKKNK
jgi:hypothetical protein